MAQTLIGQLNELSDQHKRLYAKLYSTAKAFEKAGMIPSLGVAFDELDKWVVRKEAEILANVQTIEVTANELAIAVREGKIPAIKAYRDRTGRGLKDSKDYIENAVFNLGLEFKRWNG
jgi:hypothetical protein